MKAYIVNGKYAINYHPLHSRLKFKLENEKKNVSEPLSIKKIDE